MAGKHETALAKGSALSRDLLVFVNLVDLRALGLLLLVPGGFLLLRRLARCLQVRASAYAGLFLHCAFHSTSC